MKIVEQKLNPLLIYLIVLLITLFSFIIKNIIIQNNNFEKKEGKYYKMKIIGDEKFVAETEKALSLIQSKAPNFYHMIKTYVGIIKFSEHSGMFAWENPPAYAVGKETAYHSTIWYASTIVHDAYHSKLYHDYVTEHPSENVPEDIWTGEKAETMCLKIQYDALQLMGADENTLEYIKNAAKTKYWEVPYEKRNW